ncbi:hypothetical protein [Photobacterium halotolerans]|uniref:Uncharacterized protein n=1 Tax=Photobacterium halotolerans TaxID=265726 RepID=A0A0F5VH24_9GAMM|nr:hypothetical protein [Photobacterium halotolerans]KKD01419.1 hypothetical protein KY46_00895 [Photobacterium halotolerans]
MKNTTVRLSGRGGLLSHNQIILDKNLTSDYSKFFKSVMGLMNDNELIAQAFQNEHFLLVHGDDLAEGFRLLELRKNAASEFKEKQARLRARDKAENEHRAMMREKEAEKSSEAAFKERFQVIS